MSYELEYKGYTIEIGQDEYAESPREWDNLGTMVCQHHRYTLGDENLEYHGESILDDLKQHLKDKGLELTDVVYLPLYLYDHSGITMSTTPFSCRWDSGQVGWIYVTKEQLRREYGVKRVSKALREKVEEILKAEVETYDQYLRGEVYYWAVVDENGDNIDAVCGYYDEDEAIAEAKGIIDYRLRREA